MLQKMKAIFGIIGIIVCLSSFTPFAPDATNCMYKPYGGPWVYKLTITGVCYFNNQYDGDVTGCNGQEQGICTANWCDESKTGCEYRAFQTPIE